MDLETDGVTIVIAFYNEADRIGPLVGEVLEVCAGLGRPFHVRLVDDGSTDWTEELRRALGSHAHVSLDHLFPNRGKGAALDVTLPEIRTPFTLTIDGDHEYPPADIPAVLEPLLAGRADWVFGSRYGFGRERPPQYLLTYLANQAFCGLFSLLSGNAFRDVLSGLYAFRTELVSGLRLREHRFAYTPELLWKVFHRHHPRWLDVPVSYRFRTYGQGKKIRWWEAFTVLRAILWYRFARQ